MIIIRRNQEWLIKKIYPSFYLCTNKIGIRECFLRTEIDGVPNYLGKGEQQIFYLDDMPYTIKQIMIMYKLTRSQVDYRIKNRKSLPDGRIIQVVTL